FGLIGYYFHQFSASPEDHTVGLIALNLIGAGMFVGKSLMIVFVQMWIRWTLPRPRIDQVLYTCVKVLLPLACMLLLGAAVWQLLVPDVGANAIPWIDYRPYRFGDFAAAGSSAQFVIEIVLALLGVGSFF